jgi:hypothetical protein
MFVWPSLPRGVIDLIMMSNGEGKQSPLYCNVVSRKPFGAHGLQPPFKLLQQQRDQAYHEESNKGKEMEVEVEFSHPKVARAFVPGKCIPQVDMTLRYVVSYT